MRTALGRPQPITAAGGARRRGERPSQLTDRGGAEADRILRLSKLRYHVQVHGLLTGLFPPLWWEHLHPKAQYTFHLTVIHEILQAYLQVLRRLLLNLPLSTAQLTAAPCDIFPSLSWAEGFQLRVNLWKKKKKQQKNCDFWKRKKKEKKISTRRNNKLGEKKKKIKETTGALPAVASVTSPCLPLWARRVPRLAGHRDTTPAAPWLQPDNSQIYFCAANPTTCHLSWKRTAKVSIRNDLHCFINALLLFTMGSSH